MFGSKGEITATIPLGTDPNDGLVAVTASTVTVRGTDSFSSMARTVQS